ncbi:MAG: zf-HC2 domain-containing protein [Acidobacteria bacterium]|nr:zf-HC2 domain-containing protein [Acidobacteriota bacterium]
MTSSDRSDGMTSCAHAELIDAWVDGAVSEAERRSAEQHIAECAACRDEARELSALHELLTAERLSPEPLAVDLHAPRTRRRAGRRRAAVAAAGLVAVFGGVLAVLAPLAAAAGSAASAAATLFDFTVTLGMLGAGLLDASWRGLNVAMSSAPEPATPALLFGGAAVLGLTGLLFSLLRRGAKASARQRSRR